MPSYQHILLAIDFSYQDNQIIEKATRLTLFAGAKLSLIHVLDNIPMPDTPYGTVIALDEVSSDALLEAEKRKINAIGDELGVDLERRWMIWGEPGQEIVRIAKQEKVDLIMVGSHGKHGLALLLGSTSNDVLRHADCDVLAVRLQE